MCIRACRLCMEYMYKQGYIRVYWMMCVYVCEW